MTTPYVEHLIVDLTTAEPGFQGPAGADGADSTVPGPAGADGAAGPPGPNTYRQHIVIWAEENGATATGRLQEWSFGNGAVGSIGIPLVGSGWELVGVSAQADVANTTSALNFIVVDYQSSTVADLYTVNDASNEGQAANYHWRRDLSAAPVALPVGCVLGFETLNSSGSVSDGRLCAFLERTVTI